MSSKFSSPFFKKSPLQGAYASGAGGMINVSYNDIHQKFQNDIGENVDRAYAKEKNPCNDPKTVQYTENSVLKKCPKKTSKTTVNGIKENQSITGQATEVEFDINSMQADEFGGFGSNSTNERGTIS